MLALLLAATMPLLAQRFHPPSNYPLWVSGRTAFDERGEIRDDLMRASTLQLLRETRAKNSDGCVIAVGAPTPEDFKRRDSTEALAAEAKTIVVAEVVDSDTGFFESTPGALLAFHVREALESSAAFRSRDGYLFVPEAIIPTPLGVICSRLIGTGSVPKVGDSVLVFGYFEPADIDASFLYISHAREFVVNPSEELLARVRALTSRSPRTPPHS